MQLYPEGIEREYVRLLEGLTRDMTRGVLEALRQVERGDADVKDREVPFDSNRATRFTQKLGPIEVDVYRTIRREKAETAAKGIGRRVAQQVERQVDGQIKAVLGISLLPQGARGVTEAALERWTRTNVDLIKTVPERYFSQIREVVAESVTVGRRAKDLEKLVEERGAVAGYNARRIARDQTSKLVGQITEARQTALGITEFVWRTSGDERVREEHAALDGETFSWRSGAPGVGLPGEPIQCRCRAEPVLDDLLSGL